MPSRSTISCALRTQAAGSPAVSANTISIGRPSSPPLAFCHLAQNSQPRFICWPTEPSGPVSAIGTPILIESRPAPPRHTAGAAAAARPPRMAARRVNGVVIGDLPALSFVIRWRGPNTDARDRFTSIGAMARLINRAD